MPRTTAAVAPLLVALAAGLGCRGATAAGTGQAAAAAPTARAEPRTHLVCEDEKPTGSNIPVRTCRRVLDDPQRDHARDVTIDELNRPQVQVKSGR
jgi:hypothetical protein